MQAFIETAAYMPHGYCLLWQPWLVALYAGSDLLIFLSYSAIPVALMLFLRRRPDVRYGGIVALFAAFIMLCGLTHLISIVTLWVPAYPLHGLVKLVTGVVSTTTAVVLFLLIPKLVAIPSPQQLERANSRLVEEIAAHRETLARLQDAERAVDRRIEQRTADLAEADRQLSVTSREAVHRGVNLTAVIMSLARETARRAPDLATFMRHFSGRVEALSGATASLAGAATDGRALLGEVVRRQLAPMIETYAERIAIDGPEIRLTAQAAQHFALAAHELATNAVKYGSLSTAEGTVEVAWESAPGDPDALRFRWRETGAPAPQGEWTDGFGTKLLTIVVPGAMQGTANRAMERDGLAYELRVPLSHIAAEPPDRGGEAPGDPLAPQPA